MKISDPTDAIEHFFYAKWSNTATKEAMDREKMENRVYERKVLEIAIPNAATHGGINIPIRNRLSTAEVSHLHERFKRHEAKGIIKPVAMRSQLSDRIHIACHVVSQMNAIIIICPSAPGGKPKLGPYNIIPPLLAIKLRGGLSSDIALWWCDHSGNYRKWKMGKGALDDAWLDVDDNIRMALTVPKVLLLSNDTSNIATALERSILDTLTSWSRSPTNG